jgi:hypothetical protein
MTIRIRWIVAGALAGCLALGAGLLAPLAGVPAAACRPYALSVSVAPQPNSASQITCEMALRDAVTGELLFAPHITTAPGDPASVESVPQQGEPHYRAVFTPSPDGTSSAYEVSVSAGDKVLMSQKASVRVR